MAPLIGLAVPCYSTAQGADENEAGKFKSSTEA
jgi:hypothetical protein